MNPSARALIRATLGIALVAMATVVFTTSTLADYTIYHDDFDGNGDIEWIAGDPLNDTVPDIAPLFTAPWYAGETTFFNDGTVDSDALNGDPRGGGGAYLSFEPEAGHIYTTSGDVINLTQGSMGFGYVENPINGYIDDDSGRHDQAADATQWMKLFAGSTSFKEDKSTTVGDNFTGLSGTYSFEITLDTYDPANVMVSSRIDDNSDGSWVVWDLDPLSAATAYNAGPLASMGTNSTGIHGIGFSVNGTSAGSTVDGIDNFLLISDGDSPPALGIQVDLDTNMATLLGDPTRTIDINSYQITSAQGSLDPTAWNSLDDQNLGTFEGLAGDFTGDDLVNSVDLSDPVEGWEARFGTDLGGSDFLDWQGNFGESGTPTDWEEGGAVNPNYLGEAILVGHSTIAAGASFDLGAIFDKQGGPPGSSEDWELIFRTAEGKLVPGIVSYVSAAQVAASVVPEPSSLVLVAVGLLGMGYRHRKQM